MAGQSSTIQRLATLIFVCLLMMGASVGEPVRCHDCQHCERNSTDHWRSVDCGDGACAKRVVSGYTVDVGPYKSTHRFCEEKTDVVDGCRKRTLNERVNGWLVKMASVEVTLSYFLKAKFHYAGCFEAGRRQECWCSTDYCNAATGTVSPTLTVCLLTALASAWSWIYAL